MYKRDKTAYLIDSWSPMSMWMIVRGSCLAECCELQDTIAGGLLLVGSNQRGARALIGACRVFNN